MLQTTLICGFGMLVFGLSEFVPTSRFAILMFVLLAAALFADMVLLPAILMGRWGRFFEPAPLANNLSHGTIVPVPAVTAAAA